MECRRCLLTDQETVIRDGQCEFCHTHDKLAKLDNYEITELSEKLRMKKGYQVLLGISGGLDSSYLLWYTVNMLKLKPLVIHFNNGWNDPIATNNMSLLVQKLRVDFLEFHSDAEYDELCGCFLRAGVKDADIPNDIYMTELMRRVAFKYKIKYAFNGHDFRTEGSTPLAWTYMDARYIDSVYTTYSRKKLKTFMNYTLWKQIKSALYGIKNVRIFHHMTITDEMKRNTMINFGWKDYGAKHGENIYTKFIGYYLLPNKWGIDKRINYKSALVRSGRLDKNQAKFDLKKGVEFDKAHFPEIERRTGVSVAHALAAPKQTYEDFSHYNFKRWKPVLWVMVKLGLTSYNFYKKYT